MERLRAISVEDKASASGAVDLGFDFESCQTNDFFNSETFPA